MKTMAYIFGQPGSGKTTLVSEILREMGAKKLYDAKSPIQHRGFSCTGGVFAVLGSDAYPFGGTDTLSYTSVSTCHKWLKELSLCSSGGMVLAEGDRLANRTFFSEARKIYDLHLFYLKCPDEIAKQRRQERALEHKLNLQNTSWVSGRITKSKNLAATENVYCVDSSSSPSIMAKFILSRWIPGSYSA